MGQCSSSSGSGQGVDMGGGREETVVMDFGESTSSCGYCRSPNDSRVTHDLMAYSMTVDDYQELLDRGWRRAGTYIYKPDMKRTCCPQYTIRLKAEDFVPSKEQARVVKKMERFLNGKLLLKNADCSKSKLSVIADGNSSSLETVSERQIQENVKMQNEETNHVSYLSRRINDAVEMLLRNGELSNDFPLPKAVVKEVRPGAKKKHAAISDDLLYTSSISFQIVATFRRSVTATASSENNHGEFVKHSPNEVAKKLERSLDELGIDMDVFVKACNGHLNFYSSLQKMTSIQLPSIGNVIDLSTNDIGASTSQSHKVDGGSTIPLKKHIMEVRMKRSNFDPEEYALYRKYETTVQNKEPNSVTEHSFKCFLVDSPLVFSPPQSGREGSSCGFGSFHQQYLIDGKIVAVGVVDILPKCLSSVYLFYDPDFAYLSLGKFSALKEIEWVKQANGQCQSVEYYYLGYYIHSCSKMRYKADYRPSELLCPLRYRWVPFRIAKPLFDMMSYVVLSNFLTAENGDSEQSIPNNSLSHEGESRPEDGRRETSVVADVISNITIDSNGSRKRFKDMTKVRRRGSRVNRECLKLKLQRYEKVVGSQLAGSMIYLLE